MAKKITDHVTGVGEIQFMAVARALLNQKTGKEEYSLKIKLKSDDASIAHLKEVAEYKIDTKTNRALEGTGEVIVNFTSDFAPTVLSADNTKLTGTEIPFFDGRRDKGTAAVSYKVIDYGNNKIVRLAGVKLVDLDLAPREETSQTTDQLMEQLKNIGS